jgi:hypothetical protein
MHGVSARLHSARKAAYRQLRVLRPKRPSRSAFEFRRNPIHGRRYARSDLEADFAQLASRLDVKPEAVKTDRKDNQADLAISDHAGAAMG